MKSKILKFYYLNMISFKCSPLLFIHKRILRTVFSMTFSVDFFYDVFLITEEYLLPQPEDLDMQNLWLQQDEATPHTARKTMAILRAAFPCLISRFGDVPWPPRSPDLTPPDFFL